MGNVSYRRAPSANVDERVEVVGTAINVYGTLAPNGAYAAPTDVYGATAQYSAADEWVGCIGIFQSYAGFASVPTTLLGAGAWAFVNIGSGTFSQYTWSGSSWITATTAGTLNVRNTSTNTILPSDVCIRYTGSVDITFNLPAATGSDRLLRFIHAGSVSAKMMISTAANGGTVNGDTLIIVSKGSTSDSVPVEVVDADVATWSISG